MPKSRPELQNMKELIQVLLDLKILLCADIAWQHSGKRPDAELATTALMVRMIGAYRAKTKQLLQAYSRVGGNIRRAAQQRVSGETPLHRAERVFSRRAGLVRAGSPYLRRRRRAGRCLRSTRAKAAKPPPAIGVHLPVESSARKLLLVALPPPHFDVRGENHTNAKMQTRHNSFCI